MQKDSRTSYSREPVELPLDDWLYSCNPTPGCDICGSLNKELAEARKKRDWKKAWEVSTEIRSCRGKRSHVLKRKKAGQ